MNNTSISCEMYLYKGQSKHNVNVSLFAYLLSESLTKRFVIKMERLAIRHTLCNQTTRKGWPWCNWRVCVIRQQCHVWHGQCSLPACSKVGWLAPPPPLRLTWIVAHWGGGGRAGLKDGGTRKESRSASSGSSGGSRLIGVAPLACGRHHLFCLLGRGHSCLHARTTTTTREKGIA